MAPRYRVRHVLTAHPSGVGPGWYIVDTSWRPERVVTRELTYAEAHDPATLRRVEDRCGRLETER